MGKNENIEISRILDIVKSKKLVIATILVIFIVLGCIYSYHYVVPKYKATSSLLLIPNSASEGKVIVSSDLTVNADLTVNSGLIETYRSIGENSKVIKQVIQNLGLDMTEEELLKEMKITVMKDTYVIQVEVTNTNAQVAMEIAKEFDEVFLKEIGEIYHLNNVGIVDEAQLPEEPYNINHGKDMVLFMVAGIGVAFAAIMIFYVFDNTIKSEEEIEKYVHLKSLGSIPLNQDKTQELVSRQKAKSYVTECINTIRTNILYMNSAKNAQTILITSCTPREGKSWVSANIATAFAETDQKVLLIDSDMRKGRAHKIFKVSNDEGLSNYLYAMTGNHKKDVKLGKQYIQETKIPNLHILTNGAIPPNPSELLESGKMKDLLNALKKVYDIIIVDAPPCKLVTDSIILSTIVDSTILVANSEKTKMKDFNEVKKSIQMVDGEIIGAILNKKKISGKTYSTGYYYGHSHSEELEVEKEREIISVEKLIKKAVRNWKEMQTEVSVEEIEEVIEPKEPIAEGKKENIDYQKIKSLMEVQIKELADNMKESNYMQVLLEKAEEEKLTKQDIEDIIKQEIEKIDTTNLKKEEVEEIIKQEIIHVNYQKEMEKIQEQLQESKLGTNEKIVQMQEEMQKTLQEEITKVDYAEQIQNIKESINASYENLLSTMQKEKGKEIQQFLDEKMLQMQEDMQKAMKEEILKVDYTEQIQNMKEMMKKNNEDLLDNLQKEKDSEQAMQLLFNERITQVQEEMQRTVQQEMTKIDYTEQILTINEMLNNLKDSYLEIVNEMKVREAEKAIEIEQEPKETRKSKNIIDFKTLRKQKTKKMVYSIEEDIAYEDLAQTATYIIPLRSKSEEACENII